MVKGLDEIATGAYTIVYYDLSTEFQRMTFARWTRFIRRFPQKVQDEIESQRKNNR